MRVLNERSERADEKGVETNVAGKQALIATDQPATASAVRSVLLEHGFSVVRVGGREAVNRLGQGVWTLVVTDIFMADTDGIEIIDVVRTWTPDTYVIAIENTILGSLDFVRIALMVGADAALRTSEIGTGLAALLPVREEVA